MAGAPQSDLERFKAQQNAVADQSLESTRYSSSLTEIDSGGFFSFLDKCIFRNMVRLVEESQAAGVNTITMLEQQVFLSCVP